MSNGMELQVLNVSQHEQFLSKQRDRLDKWCLPASNLRADALMRHALHEMSVDDKLQACTPTSIYLALMACAVTGLVPGKMRSLAFLIPFNNTKKMETSPGHAKEVTTTEATFMPGWRGIKLTGFRAGLDMVSAVIHQNDDFDFDKGTTPFVRYKPALKGAGPVIGTACWVKLPRGGLEIEYLDLDTLGKIEMAAKAKSGGKSPAWDGPFKDQMQRKSALRRLGKQIEMGEDFHRAELIENTHDASGSIASAIDIITEGEATRVLSAASTEAAVFGGAPRPAQVQVPAQIEAPAKPAAAPAPAAAKAAAKPPAGSAKADPPANKLEEAKAKVEAKRPPAAPTSQSGTPATQAAGGKSPEPSAAASPTAGAAGSAPQHAPATPTANSPASTPPASASTAPAIDTTATESSASSDDDAGDFGDVASEPGPDEEFDTAFGDEEGQDENDGPPTTREGWLSAFQLWASQHPTRESVLADGSWKDVFQGWANACQTKAEMEADKKTFIDWAKERFSKGRPADPANNVAAIAPDTGSVDMQKMFAARYKAVP